LTAAPVLSPTLRYTLKIVQGDSLGSVFVFDKAVVTIGRGSDNDVVLAKDSKTSRQHAEIRIENNEIRIVNLSSTNFTLLNGMKIENEVISGTGDIRIGGTTFKLKVDQGSQAPSILQPVQNFAQPMNLVHHENQKPAFNNPYAQPTPFAQPPPPNRPRSQRVRTGNGGGNRLQFYMIVLSLGIGFWFFFGDGDAVKKPEVRLRTEGDVARSIQESAVAVQEIRKQQQVTGKNSLQYRSAQENYIKGFRDNRQGQYARAIQSFQAALSFYPNHELARKYILLSQRKFDEMINFNMSQGRKYYQKQNHKMCQAAFANVMVMLKDPSKQKYIEAKQLHDECKLRTEAKF
jgi:hypothetical protein